MKSLDEKLSSLGDKIKKIRQKTPNANAHYDKVALGAFEILKKGLGKSENLLANATEEQMALYEQLLKQTMEYSSDVDASPEQFNKQMLEMVKTLSSVTNDSNPELTKKLKDVAKEQVLLSSKKSSPGNSNLILRALNVASIPFFNPAAIAGVDVLIDKVSDMVRNRSSMVESATKQKIERAELEGELKQDTKKEGVFSRDRKLDPNSPENMGPQKTGNNKRQSNDVPVKVPSNKYEPRTGRGTETPGPGNEPTGSGSPIIPTKEDSDSGYKKTGNNKTVKIDKLEITSLIIKKLTFPRDMNKKIGNVVKNTVRGIQKQNKPDMVKASLFDKKASVLPAAIATSTAGASEPASTNVEDTGSSIPVPVSGNLLKSATKLLGRAAAPLMIAGGAYEAYSGYKDAEDDLRAEKINESEATTRKGEAIGSGGGGVAGGLAGAAAGAAIGSVVPVVGTAIGGLIGGAAGYYGGSSLGKKVGGGLASSLTKDRATGEMAYDAMGNAIGVSAPVDVSSSISRMKNDSASKTSLVKEATEEKRMYDNDKNYSTPTQPVTVNNITNMSSDKPQSDSPSMPAKARTDESSFKRWQDNAFFG